MKQDYACRDRRRVLGPLWEVYLGIRLAKIALGAGIVLVLVGLVCSPARAQTPQDGYWQYNMTPEGMNIQNPAQGYGGPSVYRTEEPSRDYGSPYTSPPVYYNEYGQPSTVPDPRQYQDIEGVGM